MPAFDAFTDCGVGTTSHTCTGTDRLLTVGVFTNTADGTFTGITYNGTSLTKGANIAVDGGTQQVHIWYLVNPASGANNIVTAGTDPYAQVLATSVTGIKQSAQPDASTTGTASSATSVSTTLTTVANGSWVAAMVRGDAGDAKSNNSGVADTNRDGLSNKYFWDANGSVGASGGKTVSYSAAASQGWGLATMSFSPEPAVPDVSTSDMFQIF